MKLIINKLTQQVIAKTTDDNYIALDENHEVINAPITHKIEHDITALFWDGEKLYQGDFLENKILMAKQWRNTELSDTDWVVPVIDHTQRAAYMTFRQELRDYPSQADFPNGTRPIKP